MELSAQSHLGETQCRFRALNRRLAALAPRSDSSGEGGTILCECSDQACVRPLLVELAEYRLARTNPCRFIVAPGHLNPAEEVLVRRGLGRYLIVDKYGEAGAAALASDAPDGEPPR